jgi:hypothetical protein
MVNALDTKEIVMKVKDLIKAFKDREIHEEMDIRIILNKDNPEDEDFDEFFNSIEVWGWGEDSCVDLFIHKGRE